jgi:hypothetical protein
MTPAAAGSAAGNASAMAVDPLGAFRWPRNAASRETAGLSPTIRDVHTGFALRGGFRSLETQR